MRVVLITTDTSHHRWFAWRLAQEKLLAGVVVETRSPTPAFDTAHPYENERRAFEVEAFFGGDNVPFDAIHPATYSVMDINNQVAVTAITDIEPHVVIVFGSGIVREQVIALAPHAIVNLHGGDPEEYRGLDTHLWAIYHGDFSALVTTLHRVNAELDDGEIVSQAAVPVAPGMPLHQLRYHNTLVCADLTLAALAGFNVLGRFVSRPQRRRGRYYSAMPAVLKEVCVRKFERYTAGLVV